MRGGSAGAKLVPALEEKKPKKNNNLKTSKPPQSEVCVFTLVQKNVTLQNQLQTADTRISPPLPHSFL